VIKEKMLLRKKHSKTKELLDCFRAEEGIAASASSLQFLLLFLGENFILPDGEYIVLAGKFVSCPGLKGYGTGPSVLQRSKVS
jgi:hypothetical protein